MSENEHLNDSMDEMSTQQPKKAKKLLRSYSWKHFAGLAVLVTLIVLSVIYAVNRKVVVDEVRFEGHYFTDLKSLNEISASSIGRLADSLRIDSLIRQLHALPYVKSAGLYVEPSGSLVISIQERQPLALLIQDQIFGMLDEEGNILPYEKKFIDLPLLHGFNGRTALSKQAQSKKLQTILSFLTSLKKDPFANATISEVVYNQDLGIVAMSNAHGVKLTFGHEAFAKKFENWKVFNSQVVKNRGLQVFQEVDLRFPNQIITREV